MKKLIFTALMLSAGAIGAQAQTTLYVSPDGSDSGDGSQSSPFATVAKAVETVQPGGSILVHAGTYYITERIKIPRKETSEQSRIRLFAYGDGEVIIDGTNMNPATAAEFKMARCMYFPYWANYWHVKGITFQNAKDNGVKVEGSHNIFEHCVFRDNNDTGLQIGMFKDWTIEEFKSLPGSGQPEFNPGYAYCLGNKVINCDSYNNYDATVFGGGSDDGGDADGFACKLFPGPGTEFHGCRAWNNSDDNWDLYMVYHPVVIDNCYAFNAAIDRNGRPTPGNGNGFKLGGGGSSGGAAFEQSTGAHLVRNCVAWNNTKKGFDQNNACEAMYLINNVAWGNDFNYRFPTKFDFGTMYLRNCVGFNARTLNHEFLSENKEGFRMPDTEFNSWTTIDGCDPIKDGNKVGKNKVFAADHSGEFLSLLEADAKAGRLPDGSLPENGFARLRPGSRFVDAGQAITDFNPARFMTEAEAAAAGIDLATLPEFSIEYNDASADMGAYESGVPTAGKLYLMSGRQDQTVYTGSAIEPVVVKWGGAATDVTVAGADALTVTKDAGSKTVTISGTLSADTEVTITTVGGETAASLTISLSASTVAPGTLACTSGNASQAVFYDTEITPIVFELGGGATAFSVKGLPEGLESAVEGRSLTITGIPVSEGTYTVTATGGMTDVSVSGTISLEIANRVLTGGWYHIQDAWDAIPADLQGVVSVESDDAHPSAWDPEYDEKGTVPGGCTRGAVNVGQGGALVWTLPSLLELKANIHFTGSRTLQVKWQVEGEEEHNWTSSRLKKSTLTAWDFMACAGIPQTDRPVTVKFLNPASLNNGGIRVYDFYVKVYAKGDSGAETVTTPTETLDYYLTDGAVILSLDNIASASLYSLDGRPVSSTIASQVIPLHDTHGLHILRVTTADGRTRTAKVALP